MNGRQKRDLLSAAFWWAALIFTIGFWYAVFLLFVWPAFAHTAQSGWQYPTGNGCCSDVNMECQEIPGSRVQRLANGEFRVVLYPGDHRHVKVVKEYKPNNVWPSGDGQFHACISVSGASMYCLYIPLNS